jgi:predicted AAA+ superfamily ATPase
MKRKIYDSLLAWKQNGSKKPLMVIGARQIGKTYTVEEFGAKEFSNFLSFNLFYRKDIVDLFAANINTQDKIDQLELIVREPIDFENTLLFFDEVQESEELIETLKYFAESEQHYNIICAGSLLGVKLKRFKHSFPVGKVELLHMYPLDFEEYLWASSEMGLSQHIRECFVNNTQLITSLHERCLKLVRQYICVGGMPEAVKDFIEHDNQILRFNSDILSAIYQSYLSDMSKYINSPQEATRIAKAYDSMPAQLANNSHKFQYAKIKRGAKGREYGSALSWLEASAMVYECQAVTQPNAPLKGFANPDMFKFFINDSGILCSLLDVRPSDIMLDTAFFYKGIIVENYVAGQFAATGVPLYYWRDESNAEVDFLISTPDGIIPVEVKAGTNKKTPSLKLYQEKYKPTWSIKITAKNFGFVNKIKSVPLYAAYCIKDIL